MEGLRQSGVVRTNCVDSLDRTNAAQFCIGKIVFGYQVRLLFSYCPPSEHPQMYLLGLSDEIYLKFDDEIALLLMQLYEDMGNQLALQ